MPKQFDNAQYRGALANAIAIGAILAFAAPASAHVPVPGLENLSSVHLAAATGRKGTRSYRPDGATAAPLPAAPQRPSSADAMKLCMETWDEGTHITLSKWREICQRQIRDRDSMRSP